jgi:hypothetical protein
MMNQKLKLQTLKALLFLVVLVLQACAPPVSGKTDGILASSTPFEIPTWTLRPQDQTATPILTATKPAPVIKTATATPFPVNVTPPAPTPKTVSVAIVGGNLFVHRGPSLYHNFVGVLYNGETVFATGRDRISRWLRVEVPSKPGVEGWITTETQYTRISGDVVNLPYIETEPALPAYIRNCTRNTMWILPADVQLLGKFDTPYNEEQFPVGTYQVIDMDYPGTAKLEDINLSEGRTVDIRYDGSGTKSKCE